MARPDETLLLDMLLAARRIQQFVAGVTQSEFEAHQMMQSAVIREIQVIGEAARMITDKSRAAHPSIDWPAIAGMRNRVIHEYFEIDLKIVWDTIQGDIPALIGQLEAIVPPDEPDNEDFG
jgi:uncharacterized protein with HEPN domain